MLAKYASYTESQSYAILSEMISHTEAVLCEDVSHRSFRTEGSPKRYEAERVDALLRTLEAIFEASALHALEFVGAPLQLRGLSVLL
jgi:hypothetical protein